MKKIQLQDVADGDSSYLWILEKAFFDPLDINPSCVEPSSESHARTKDCDLGHQNRSQDEELTITDLSNT